MLTVTQHAVPKSPTKAQMEPVGYGRLRGLTDCASSLRLQKFDYLAPVAIVAAGLKPRG